MNEKLKHTPGPWNEKGIYVILRYADKHDMDIEISDETMPWSREDAKLIAAVPDLLEDKIKDFDGIGKWLSAALEDPNVCEEMKQDIREWFDMFSTVEKATGLKIEEVLK